MKKSVIEGYCIPCIGPEEDYLKFSDDRLMGISDIVQGAGVESVSWQTFAAHESLDDEYFQKYKQEQNPRFYRIKITVEAEELTQEKSDELWKSFRDLYC